MAPAADRLLHFAIPGDIETPSGGYGYDRLMMAELRALGWTVRHLPLPGGFPEPSGEDLEQAAACLANLPGGSLVMVDGLAFGAMPDVAAAEAERLRLVALVHHPLALETGLSPDVSRRLKASETLALKATRGVVVTSAATARTLLDEFEVSSDRIAVVVPGTAPRPAAERRVKNRLARQPLILSVGSLTRRKDHALLISALARLADRPWQCRIVGSDMMDPETAHSLRIQIEGAGLGARVTLTGAVRDIEAEYEGADLFALASRYEGFGMAFAEALAHGLPIVGCRGGAIPDVVPDSAGILVEPGDVEAFARALARLLDDPEALHNYAEGALAAGRDLPDWRSTAATLSGFLETIR